MGIVVSQEKNEDLRLLLAVLWRAAETWTMYEWIAGQRKLRRLMSGLRLLGIGESSRKIDQGWLGSGE